MLSGRGGKPKFAAGANGRRIDCKSGHPLKLILVRSYERHSYRDLAQNEETQAVACASMWCNRMLVNGSTANFEHPNDELGQPSCQGATRNYELTQILNVRRLAMDTSREPEISICYQPDDQEVPWLGPQGAPFFQVLHRKFRFTTLPAIL